MKEPRLPKVLILTTCVLLSFLGCLDTLSAAADNASLVFADSNGTSVTSAMDPTSLKISPNILTVNPGTYATLTITVTDTSGSPTTPTGSVQLSDSESGGTFNPTSCVLSSASCTVSYDVSSNPTNSITITAIYSGDSVHNTSNGTALLSISQFHTTDTSVTPSTVTMSSGSAEIFSARVTDTSGSPSDTSGSVYWSDNNAGGTFSPPSCMLVSETCTVSYAAPVNSPASIVITAKYGGDSVHNNSTGISTLTINQLNPTNTVIMPSSTTLSSNYTSTFSVQVTDTSSTPNALSGTIMFNDDHNGGTFNPESCTLPMQTCVTTYTSPENPLNVITVNATYSGDSTHSASYAVSRISTTMLNTTSVSNPAHAHDATFTMVTANPATFNAGSKVSVTALVTDTSNQSNALIGMVSWSDGETGGIFSPNNCLLVNNQCTITYTSPSISVTSIVLTATYAGDSNHTGSSGMVSLSVSATPQSAASTTAPASSSPATSATTTAAKNPTTSSHPSSYSTTISKVINAPESVLDNIISMIENIFKKI